MGKGSHPNSLKALEPGMFKPGHKPKCGRPKGSVSITDSLRRSLCRIAEGKDPIDKRATSMPMRDWVGVALIAKAASGDVAAIKELLNRVEGAVTEKMELTGSDGKPIEIEHSRRLQEAWGDITNAFVGVAAITDEGPSKK